MVRFGVPGQNINTLAYADERLPVVPMVQSPRRPTVNDKKFPLWCEWRTDKNVTSPVEQGEFWKLIRFESNGDATWVRIDAQGTVAGVDDIRDQVNASVSPSATGTIDIDGATVAAGANPSGIPVETVANPGTNTLDVQVQLSSDITGIPADSNDAGLCSFDDTSFTVDANGYVTLISGAGPAVAQIGVDFNTGPGTDPVDPTSPAGQISVLGNVVTNGTNANSPVGTHSRALNQFHVDVQLSTALTVPADPYDAGLLSVDNKYFTVDGNGFMSLTDVLLQPPEGTTYNIGIDYTSPTFKVTSANGTALSATNPGYVILQSRLDKGKTIIYEITADQSFEDASGTSDIIGNLFGYTTSVAITVDVPFFIFAVSNDTETDCAFMISRMPYRALCTNAAFMANKGDTSAADQRSFFSLKAITLADYDDNPCVVVGSFRMQMDGSDDWTVQAIGHDPTKQRADGIGRFQNNVSFEVPKGQFGADSGAWTVANGGTSPVFTNLNANHYVLNSPINNMVTVFVSMDGDAGTDGAGAVSAKITTPFKFDITTASLDTFRSTAAITTPTYDECGAFFYDTGNSFTMVRPLSASTAIQWGAFTNGTRSIVGSYTMRAHTNA